MCITLHRKVKKKKLFKVFDIFFLFFTLFYKRCMCFFSLAEVKTFILKMCIIISPYKLFSAFPNKECGKNEIEKFWFSIYYWYWFYNIWLIWCKNKKPGILFPKLFWSSVIKNCSKGQIMSECILWSHRFSKIPPTNLIDFCPRRLYRLGMLVWVNMYCI